MSYIIMNLKCKMYTLNASENAAILLMLTKSRNAFKFRPLHTQGSTVAGEVDGATAPVDTDLYLLRQLSMRYGTSSVLLYGYSLADFFLWILSRCRKATKDSVYECMKALGTHDMPLG